MAIYKSSSSSTYDWLLTILNPSEQKALMGRGDFGGSYLLTGAAAMGLSVIILRFFGNMEGYGPIGSLMEWNERLLSLLFQSRNKRGVIQSGTSSTQQELMEYHGSCHCESVIFKMKAPKKLDVVHGSGKIPYPQTRVKAADFSLNRGSEYLRIYHAYNDNEVPPSTLAYSFCSECAVHIVNASDTDTNEVSVNINCLHLIRQQEENYDNVEEELDELCSLPSPSSPACRDRAPSMIDVDRSSPVSNITQPAPFKMSSINEVGDSWVLRDPSRPSHLQVDTVAPLNLATKMPSSRASSGDWPTESESNSVYSSSYISRSTFDLGSLDGSVVDAFGDADTASRQEMLRSMRKYLKTSGSRKASSSSLTSTGTVPPRPPVSLPS